MTRYAETTSVDSSTSRAEIERTLARYGAGSFAYGWDADRAMVGFTMAGRQVRFLLPLPDRGAREFTHTPARGERRSADSAEKAYEQAVRQRSRALALVVKAKLEAVAAGITMFEAEFLAHVVLPAGSTVGEWAGLQIEQAYSTGTMPQLLPGLDDTRVLVAG